MRISIGMLALLSATSLCDASAFGKEPDFVPSSGRTDSSPRVVPRPVDNPLHHTTSTIYAAKTPVSSARFTQTSANGIGPVPPASSPPVLQGLPSSAVIQQGPSATVVTNQPAATLPTLASCPPSSGYQVYRPALPATTASGRPVYYGKGLIGQPKLYVDGQPIRNFLRYLTF